MCEWQLSIPTFLRSFAFSRPWTSNRCWWNGASEWSSRVCLGIFPCQHGSQISNLRCSGPLGWCFALDVAHVGGRHGLSFPHLEGYRYRWNSFKLPVAFDDTLRWSQASNALVQQVPLRKSPPLGLFLNGKCCTNERRHHETYEFIKLDWTRWWRQPHNWHRACFGLF